MFQSPTYDLRDPFPWYEYMRLNQPVWQEDGGAWHVFRHDDVKRVLSDYEFFSSQRGTTDDPSNPIGASLISSDPPRHRQLRTLVSQAFTPRAIDDLAGRIEQIATELLDSLPEGDVEIDIVERLTTPLPVIVIAELLGVPANERARFKEWSDATIAGSRQLDAGEELTFSDAQREMVKYFSGMIAQRLEMPKDDLISGLVDAKVDGESLSHIDILGFCILLLVAGNETTTNLLSNALYTLHERPELWDELTEDPGLIPPFIEEVLRFRSPVQHMYRTCTSDVALSGVTIPAGSHLVAWIGSANRDEEVYQGADQFQIHRTARNIAFGHGIHYCLGAPLARLEARIALEALFARYQAVHIPSLEACKPVPTSLVYGFESMPTRLKRRRH
ncbi:cytochrome P450 [Alicyclobacillus fastidiosus]|uniref:Cytochrome P450 n=1 Tax=Alicyclobacillus fastidiosus TaxID=392011 RepID=A0ABV5AHE6_9BACL|nr:cytochrome P450 [Alicyclobacillus fastidiosus]WEH09206.1 cytochrome P450 [Alicyclobacillus fastidiosus]